ncbi:mechanosensitive ion channel [Allosphingosinicella indica]|uniref:Small-conductance mechanosensitive channel n=1 Tax=Allosphingosinicella indica TaxID=941907 RepID=A0A1X7GHI2_9SPHN|nr:mechanosensitive ion channel [Allosphingosinicella indica]SMF69844.1 Conserved TM helix [Allosphingosinicella indica]
MYETQNPNEVYWRMELMEWLPRVLSAVVILLVAWLLARAAKWAIARLVDKVPALKRHNDAEPGQTVGSLIGDIAFWLILLVGILLALQPLGLSQVLEPVRELTIITFAAIPNVIKAGLIFFLGLVAAKIVRRIVEGALLAANADGWLRKSGLVEPSASPAAAPQPADVPVAPTVRQVSISRSLGTVSFFLIMIPVTIAALEALSIQSISGPATEMLRTILDAIPNVLGAAALIAIGYFVGRLAKGFVEQVLPSMGFDRAVSALGFSPTSTTPSRTVGTVVMVAILLFCAIKAAELLNSPIIAVMLAQVLELGSRILFGTGIILGGVVIARIVSSLVSGADTEGWLPAILKWSIIALAVAMGLRFMGLANEIVIIAFAAIIGSAAVACALAFGLGGRPTAHKLLERWAEGNRPPSAPRRPRNPTPDDSQPPLV